MNSNNNNSKIAIAIVAMFVVALSVVGFTYAYFTASVAGNTADKSIEVKAGVLRVNYDAGDTIDVINVVPGWVSDGRTYYNSSKVEDGEIIAYQSTDNATAKSEIAALGTTEKAVGLAKPVTFSVTNTGDTQNTAYYAIKLTNIANEIPAADQENLTVALYEGEYDEATFNGDSKPTPIYSGKLNTSGVDQYIVDEVKLTSGTTVTNYYLVVSYANVEGTQNDSMGKAIKATVEVVGLNRLADGSYVDATGAAFTLGS